MGLFGGLAGFFGGRETNRSNERMARQANAISVKEARADRNFQRFMSDTAHQRAVEDMEKAGLNPLLGLTGASTPAGGSATGQMAKVENEIGAGITSALQSKQVQLQMKNIKQQVKNMKATEAKIKADTESTKQNTRMKKPVERILNKADEGYKAIESLLDGSKTNVPRGLR